MVLQTGLYKLCSLSVCIAMFVTRVPMKFSILSQCTVSFFLCRVSFSFFIATHYGKSRAVFNKELTSNFTVSTILMRVVKMHLYRMADRGSTTKSQKPVQQPVPPEVCTHTSLPVAEFVPSRSH